MRRRFQKLPKTEHQIKTKSGELSFQLAKSSQRRTLAIYVDDKAQVSVYAPSHVSEKSIFKFINEKSDWVVESIRASEKKIKLKERKDFRAGNEFYFLGEKYPVRVQQDDIKRSRIYFDGNAWLVIVPPDLSDKKIKEHIKTRMLGWYREQAKEVIGGRLLHHARIIGVDPSEIAVKTQKRLWGNCDHGEAKININWQIILSPMNVIDYVVVHELCHLIVPNHSQRFWRKVEKFLPDYKERKDWLAKNTARISLPI